MNSPANTANIPSATRDATTWEQGKVVRTMKQTLRIYFNEAKAEFLKHVEHEALNEATTLSHRIIDEAKLRAEEKARQIITVAIQRYAGDHTFENTTATIALQGDEIKGRIIGREGRNIRAFEAATGVTVLIDDTPGAARGKILGPIVFESNNRIRFLELRPKHGKTETVYAVEEEIP